jgi:hypothetical protein
MSVCKSYLGVDMKLFTEHPASVGESYGQHFASALSFSLAMLGAGLACLVHAIFPFWCVTTGSDTVRRLHARMVTHRHRDPALHASGDGSPDRNG